MRPPMQVVAWVARNFDTSLATVACSMADAILPHLVSQYLPGIDVLFLDTGYHFPETYETRDRVGTGAVGARRERAAAAHGRRTG